MNETGPELIREAREALGQSHPVFISHASVDRKQALKVCKAIESHGIPCWISFRDVDPGANYQEAIVNAIRNARALVLVFSEAVNKSDEIKKELSLASRYRVPVTALRIADVEPSDAFAYELSTRQWVDVFEGWDKSIATLAEYLSRLSPESSEPESEPSVRIRRARLGRFSPAWAATAAVMALLLAAGAWFWLRSPTGPPPGALQVRLAGFQRLSPDLPATLPDAMRDELIAAFGDDGMVRVSTAAAAPASPGPAYALGGTFARDGDQVKVISRIVNERTGTTLWSDGRSYPVDELARVPRRSAIDTSMIVRCGLFGASTYSKGLPEPAHADYFHVCENGDQPDKAIDFARKVVMAVPDFSWGWSGLAVASFNAILERPPAGRVAELRRMGIDAADKAVHLDPSNSEAFAYKSHLVDEADLVGREGLLRKAIAARPLPCGCEHHFYGDFLVEVGRLSDAIREYKRATDVLSLNADAQLSLGQVYLNTGRPDLAKTAFNAALDLNTDPGLPAQLKVITAMATGDYPSAIRSINDPEQGAPQPVRPALTAAFSALQSQSPGAKRSAVATLEGIPQFARGGMYAMLLSMLGATRNALDATLAAATIEPKRPGARSWLFTPAMASALRDPHFPEVAGKLGLVHYWKSTRTRPDVCEAKNPPAFCKAL